MYSKTHKFFEFNKRRREQGRIAVSCIWPGCCEHVLAREHAPNKVRPYTTYRIQSGRFAGLVRYPICESHRERIYDVLGGDVKLNGIKAIVNGQDILATKRVSAPLTRLVIFDKTNGNCAHCSDKLQFGGKWHVDHIHPIFKGGVTTFSNMQALCTACHDKKTSVEKTEFNKKRYSIDHRSWQNRHQLLQVIEKQNIEIARLKTIIAGYASEEEMAG